MNHRLSEAVAAVSDDFDHSQRLNTGEVHGRVNEYVPAKLSDDKITKHKTPAGYTDVLL